MFSVFSPRLLPAPKLDNSHRVKSTLKFLQFFESRHVGLRRAYRRHGANRVTSVIVPDHMPRWPLRVPSKMPSTITYVLSSSDNSSLSVRNRADRRSEMPSPQSSETGFLSRLIRLRDAPRYLGMGNY
jgi:hypothetical protein